MQRLESAKPAVMEQESRAPGSSLNQSATAGGYTGRTELVLPNLDGSSPAMRSDDLARNHQLYRRRFVEQRRPGYGQFEIMASRQLPPGIEEHTSARQIDGRTRAGI